MPVSSVQTVRPRSPSRPIRASTGLGSELPADPGKVSVIIPTFNRAAIVSRAIESALSQTYRDIEVVVVDDGSSDDTRSVVEGFGDRVRYFYQENAGVTAARNSAIRHARGEFLAFLDSDDAWAPWKLESQVAALTRFPEAGLVWSDMTALNRAGDVISDRYLRVMYKAHSRVNIERAMREVETLGKLSSVAPNEVASASVRIGDLFSEILLGNLLHTSTVLVRRAWVEQVGGFDPTFVHAGEDYEFYVRLCSVGPVVFIDAPSTYYCVGAPDQLTRPSMILEIARNNLRTIGKWLPHSAAHLTIPRRQIRTLLADSYGWLGQAELDAGNRLAAARGLVLSLVFGPRLDRRSGLLMLCALPSAVSDRLRAMRMKLVALAS